MMPGLVGSLVVFAAGAILNFALTANPNQHGFNLQTMGVILMVVGAVGAVLSLMAFVSGGWRGRRTVVDDGRGNVVRRDDVYF